jgi:hypothetical protein
MTEFKPALCSIQDAMRYLGGISRTQLYVSYLPRLETVKLGNRRMVTVASLDKLIADHMQEQRETEAAVEKETGAVCQANWGSGVTVVQLPRREVVKRQRRPKEKGPHPRFGARLAKALHSIDVLLPCATYERYRYSRDVVAAVRHELQYAIEELDARLIDCTSGTLPPFRLPRS